MKWKPLVSGIALVAVLLGPSLMAQAPTNRPARALPGPLPSSPVATNSGAASSSPDPAFQGITRPMVLTAVPALELTNGILTFDREVAAVTVADGAPEARFLFSFTNTSPAALVITNVAVSCGCTAVDLPPLPWRLQPGESGRLPVTLEVAGKSGDVTKTIQVRTDRGMKTIYVRADVRPPADAE